MNDRKAVHQFCREHGITHDDTEALYRWVWRQRVVSMCVGWGLAVVGMLLAR